MLVFLYRATTMSRTILLQLAFILTRRLGTTPGISSTLAIARQSPCRRNPRAGVAVH